MGGYGSGNWCRWSSTTTTEEIRRIDIRYLTKNNLIKPNHAGTLSWTCGGEKSGFINYTAYHDRLHLSYRFRENGGDWQGIKQTILYDRTPCNYGGERMWFLCPHCNKRIAVLYGAGPRFLCRHCYELPYSSQNEAFVDRAMRKTRKLRKRLGASDDLDEPVWDKPKGMHWKTFELLSRQESEANMVVSYEFERRISALCGIST